MTKQRFISSLLIVALLSGCSMIPDYSRPETDTPAAWSEADATNETVIAKDWWKNFNSAELNSLMEQALANNNDINASVHRVEQARALLRSTRSSLFPTIDATGDLGYDKQNNNDAQDVSENRGSAGLSVGYELDIFGRNAAERAAGEADLDAARYDSDATALIVMADVAKNYFNVLNLDERVKIAEQNLDSAKELLRIVQARFDAGATTALDVAQQKSDLATTEANRAAIVQQMKIAKSALAVLVGKPPQNLQITGKDLRSLAVPKIAAGQPSSLLERRPDIRRAEAQLLSANADIGAARAAFYPSVTLGLDWTVASSPISDPASTALALASSLAAPIFKGGLLEGNLMYSKARKAELVENYRKTVLTSFKDVEDALVAVKTAQQREASLETAMNEARKAYELSKQQYDVGSIDFQILLDSRQTMLTAEDNYIQTKNDRLAASVDLYKALGGGWVDFASPNAIITTKIVE